MKPDNDPNNAVGNETMTKASAYSPEVTELRDMFDRYRERWSEVYDQADEDMQCLSLDGPWPQKERDARNTPGQERPCLHEDVISQYHNQVINGIEMDQLGADVQPEGNGADEKTAEEVEDRIREIDYVNNAQHAYMTAAQCAIQSSMGFWEIETDWCSPDSWERCIKINAIMDPKTCLPDPDSKEPDWHDMQGFIKLSRMSHAEFRQKYPGAQIVNFEGLINDDNKYWLDSMTVQVAAIWRVKKKKRMLLFIDDGTDQGLSIFEDELPDGMKKVKRGKQKMVAFGGSDYPILRESKRYLPSVEKIITNGIEVLDRTEWEDEEIPVLVVTGRVKYEQGKRVIDSLTRKARIGQLLYDACISSIQELVSSAPKFKMVGYEGQFDTSTNWARAFRDPTAYAEIKAVTDGSPEGEVLPLPNFVQPNPPIALLEGWKQSILLSIQNSIGMTSTERKDRAAKSGKALEALDRTINVGTYHYRKSLEIAQLRGYRIINRLLPKIENTSRSVGFRNKKGEHSVRQIPDNHFQAKHEVVIGSGKYYQSLQDEQKDFSETLLASIKDQIIMLAVLPDLIRMRGLGPHGDDLAKMIEAMQPAPMQAARQVDQNGQTAPDPAVMAAMKQAQGAVQALNAHAKELEQQVIQLTDEKNAKLAELANKKEIATIEKEKAIEVATISASTKETVDSLNAQVLAIKHIADTLTQKFSLTHTANENQLDREHAAAQADTARQAQQQLAETPKPGPVEVPEGETV